MQMFLSEILNVFFPQRKTLDGERSKPMAEIKCPCNLRDFMEEED